jgi:phosphomannomutase
MSLFHQYDIRGIYGRELTEEFAYNLGKIVLKYTNAKKIVIGYDSRNSNLKLFSAISRAIIEQGVDVTHIGIVTRPMLNWIAKKHNYDLGIIITASHNPKEYNGFKFLWKGNPLYYDNGLNTVESLMTESSKKASLKNRKRHGKIISIDYIDEYVTFLSSHLSDDFRRYIKHNIIRIIADGSNGASGEIIKRFLLTNDITYELLFTHPDGNFPGHSPNPLDSDAPIFLSKKIPPFKASFGFVLDADGDRIRFVDNNGNIVDNNYIDCMIVEHLLSNHKKSAIVHDLIARKILLETISERGGVAVASKVGTSNIIQNMISNKAIFGCEMSGHRYFSVMNNEDSGMMTLVYLLNALYSKENYHKKLSQLWKKYDKYVDLGELNHLLSCSGKTSCDEQMEKMKSKALSNILAYYSSMANKKKCDVKNISTLDGISVVTKHYWFNVRPSNTEPILRFRIEGKHIKELLKAKKTIIKLIGS